MYYEVRGVPESEKPGLGSSASAIVSAFASLAEKKEDGAAAMKARHTAFLRGIGTANQERALRRRLEKHGYVPLDEAPPPKRRGAAKNGGDDDGTKSGSDLDD